MLSVLGLEESVLVQQLLKLVLELLLLLERLDEVLLSALVLCVEVSVSRVHVVELRLEFETKLHFFFVVLGVLHVLLLEFEPHLPLTLPLLFQSVVILLEHFELLFQRLFVVGLLLEARLVLLFQLLHGGVVLPGDLGDQHSVVSSTAVLEQDRKDFPDLGDDGILLLGLGQAFLDEFVEADAVDEESTIDAVNGIVVHARLVKVTPINSISRNRLSVVRLKDAAWDVEMLSILQRLVDPSLQNHRVHPCPSLAVLRPSSMLRLVLRLRVITAVAKEVVLLDLTLLVLGHGAEVKTTLNRMVRSHASPLLLDHSLSHLLRHYRNV